ncbi:hypothetical protein BGZ72_000878 [Mortierella alpina]|nr:hypothetical protein BGZ72_000878 [Mortierella alpina]
MADLFTLFCLIDGEASSNAFPVSITSAETVGDLKKLIKTKKTNAFSDVDADLLNLWRVSIPIIEDSDKVPILLNNVPDKERKKLGPATLLLMYLVQPPEETIHIVVQRPLSGNVSGCGKTRTAVELLSRAWGFYFHAGAADYGSSDMHNLDQALTELSEIYVCKDLKRNTERVRCLTFGLLYARLLILEYCLKIARGRDTFSCQRWMLLQVATPVFKDVFQELFHLVSKYIHIRHLTGTTMGSTMLLIVQGLFRKVQDLLRSFTSPSAGHSKFLVILDDSQILGRISSARFLDSDNVTVRPALAPVLFAFRLLADDASQDSVCVIPCGTSLSTYGLTWAGGASSGGKLSRAEYAAMKLSEMVVDFAGWTDEDSISSYLERIRQELDEEGKKRLTQLFPDKAVSRLFHDLRGRFRPIVSCIEDIIETNDPMSWEDCILHRQYRLTTAEQPITPFGKIRLQGSLCGELRRMFQLVRHDQSSVAFAEFRHVEAILNLAVATYATQGRCLSFKGQLPMLVEVAFGRIRIVSNDFFTTIDEPFAVLAAQNYFQSIDPEYGNHRYGQMQRAPTENLRGKEWGFSIPFEMVHVFHDKVVSTRLFHDDKPLHDMFRHKATVVGWTGAMQTTSDLDISMADFLDAHVNNNSKCGHQAVAPFFYSKEQLSGPDVVFVVRFSRVAPDGAQASSSTRSPGSASHDIFCPVFVQHKLCMKLSTTDVSKARSTVRPEKIARHEDKLREYCQPDGHFISLAVSYPTELAEYFMDTPLKKHNEGITEIVLTIDDKNIGDLFTEKHVRVLQQTKREAAAVAETAKEVKRRRQGN